MCNIYFLSLVAKLPFLPNVSNILRRKILNLKFDIEAFCPLFHRSGYLCPHLCLCECSLVYVMSNNSD